MIYLTWSVRNLKKIKSKGREPMKKKLTRLIAVVDFIRLKSLSDKPSCRSSTR